MTNEPLVTISIVSHGNAEKINFLIASLRKYENDTTRFQLILTDNLRNNLQDIDPSPWASLHILRNINPIGFAKNHNQAFKIARGRYFAILNPDLIFEQPVFDQLITSINNHQADLIAPKIVDENGVVQDSFRVLPTAFEIIRRRLPGYQHQPLEPDPNGLVQPDWIAAMFWLMPSEVYRSLNGMDDKYKLYFEDVDFCTRANLSGLKLIVNTHLRVQHDAQRSSRRNAYYLFLHIQSALHFFTSNVYKQARQNIDLS